jgi:hypothetical protein
LFFPCLRKHALSVIDLFLHVCLYALCLIVAHLLAWLID